MSLDHILAYLKIYESHLDAHTRTFVGKIDISFNAKPLCLSVKSCQIVSYPYKSQAVIVRSMQVEMNYVQFLFVHLSKSMQISLNLKFEVNV